MADMWPAKHQTGSLGVNRAYLKKAIGRILFPDKPSPASWGSSESEEALFVMEQGLRSFYDPIQVNQSLDAWEWSFLRPTEKIYTVADQMWLDLPAGYAMMNGPLQYPPSASVIGPIIQIVTENIIHEHNQPGTFDGNPRLAAVRVKNPDAGGTRFELIFWPTPDDEYELILRYKANPDLLRSDDDVPLGGQQHAQTIIEACMAAAEISRGAEGIHAKLFAERLAASVRRDQQNSAPQTLGVGRDTSDRPMDPYGIDNHDCSYNIVTYNDAVVD